MNNKYVSIDNYGLPSEEFVLFNDPPELQFSCRISDSVTGFYAWESAYPDEMLIEIWAGPKGDPLDPAHVVKPSLRLTTNRTALFVIPYFQLEKQAHYRLRYWETVKGSCLLLIEKYQIKDGMLEICPIFGGDIMSFPPEDRMLDFLNPAVIAAERALLSLKSGDIESPFFIKLEVI